MTGPELDYLVKALLQERLDDASRARRARRVRQAKRGRS